MRNSARSVTCPLKSRRVAFGVFYTYESTYLRRATSCTCTVHVRKYENNTLESTFVRKYESTTLYFESTKVRKYKVQYLRTKVLFLLPMHCHTVALDCPMDIKYRVVHVCVPLVVVQRRQISHLKEERRPSTGPALASS